MNSSFFLKTEAAILHKYVCIIIIIIMKAFRVVWRGVKLRVIIRNCMGNEIRSIYIDKYFEIWTLYSWNK